MKSAATKNHENGSPIPRLEAKGKGTAGTDSERENFKLIPLSCSQFAIVDAEDFDRCNHFKWHAGKSPRGFYAKRFPTRVNGKKTVQYLSRFIMGVTDGKVDVDHINHDTLDNRKENLRLCSRRQNLQNLNLKKTSKYPGVSWSKEHGKWQTGIFISGKKISLGHFDKEIDAAKAYEAAVRSTGEELVCKINKTPSESSDEIKFCTRLNVTCISRKGYTCLHSGPCQPCNAEGEVLAGSRWTAYPSRSRGSTA